jgi:hypothetical protein
LQQTQNKLREEEQKINLEKLRNDELHANVRVNRVHVAVEAEGREDQNAGRDQ